MTGKVRFCITVAMIGVSAAAYAANGPSGVLRVVVDGKPLDPQTSKYLLTQAQGFIFDDVAPFVPLDYKNVQVRVFLINGPKMAVSLGYTDGGVPHIVDTLSVQNSYLVCEGKIEKQVGAPCPGSSGLSANRVLSNALLQSGTSDKTIFLEVENFEKQKSAIMIYSIKYSNSGSVRNIQWNPDIIPQ
jgi:hypothetical protein